MTGPDPQTRAVYDAHAADYARRFSWAAPYAPLTAFLAALPPGGRVLDLGCGTGGAAAQMREAGFDVVALDASPGMAAEAWTRHELPVRLGDFDAVPSLGRFDGIWAHFSLLHAPRSALPRHLRDIHAALRHGGVFLVAMKTGTGSARDRLGRRYTYVTETELTGMLTDAGFTPDRTEHGADAGFDGTIAPWIMVTAHA